MPRQGGARARLRKPDIGEDCPFHALSPLRFVIPFYYACQHFDGLGVVASAVRTADLVGRYRDAAAQAIKNHVISM